MKKLTFNATVPKVYFISRLAAVAVIAGLSFGNIAAAESMSESEYKFLEKNIEVEFTAAKIRCNSVTGAAFNKCITEAEAIKNSSKMDLEAQRKITTSSASSHMTNHVDGLGNIKTNITNVMPVLDKLNPISKRSRLI